MVGLHPKSISRNLATHMMVLTRHHPTTPRDSGEKGITTESLLGLVTSHLQALLQFVLKANISKLLYDNNIGPSDVCSSNLTNKSSDGNRLPGLNVISLHFSRRQSRFKPRRLEGVLDGKESDEKVIMVTLAERKRPTSRGKIQRSA